MATEVKRLVYARRSRNDDERAAGGSGRLGRLGEGRGREG